MKKLICIVCALAIFCALFTGCGKSAEATKADDLIIAIGKVNADSGKAIDDAEFYYSMLTDKQKQEVEHYDYLLQARSEYDALIEATSVCKVPALKNLTEKKAIAALEEVGLVPAVEYRYSDSDNKGKVLSSRPAELNEVEPGSTVTLIVSQGSPIVHSKDSYMHWTYIGSAEDDWEFTLPYVDLEEHMLYYNATVTFGTAMTWSDRYDKGCASGTASINDSFDKVIPAHIYYPEDGQTCAANQPQDILIGVSTADLDTEYPTDMYFKIKIEVNGVEKELQFNIAITW